MIQVVSDVSFVDFIEGVTGDKLSDSRGVPYADSLKAGEA